MGQTQVREGHGYEHLVDTNLAVTLGGDRLDLVLRCSRADLVLVLCQEQPRQDSAASQPSESTPIDGRMDVRLLAAARKEPEPYVADVAPLLSQLLSS